MVGGSQGGLLVGTAITQRPELFNAAIIQVPLFDMLRYHLIGAGASWIGEYGDPRIPEQRAWIEGYSPYQKLTAGRTYPMPFIHTSTADDRVHPGHGRKAAARLAAARRALLLLREYRGRPRRGGEPAGDGAAARAGIYLRDAAAGGLRQGTVTVSAGILSSASMTSCPSSTSPR